MLDPIARYKEWFAEAAERAKEMHQVQRAAFLAAVDADGRPCSRINLIQHADERGFVFFTNLGSAKARDLSAISWPAGGSLLVVAREPA